MKPIHIFFYLLPILLLISCEKDPVNTNIITDNSDNYTPKHIKNVLLEDYTGTWCGYCPRMAKAVDAVLSSSDKVAAVAVHDDDDLGFYSVKSMETTFGITGFPTGLIDRRYKWSSETLSGLNAAFDQKAPLGIKIASSVNGETALINVSVEFATDINYDTYITVYLTEDNLVASQRNYYNDGRGDPIANFVHDHVLRKSATDVFGDKIANDQTKKDNVINFSYTLLIGTNNASKCNVVAFVSKANGNDVQNVQFLKLGETKDFQYLAK